MRKVKRKIKFGKVLGKIHAWNMGVLIAIWQTSFGKALLCAATGFAVIAVIIGASTYNQGHVAEEHAQLLLNEYEQGDGLPTVKPDVAVEVGNVADATIAAPEGIALDEETYAGYGILCKLDIEKTGQQLPIIAGIDDGALDVSCCYYKGALPGEAGNMVVTGHNYADGAIFGNLDLLIIGDDITLTTPDNTYRYQIYEFTEVEPDDVSALDEYVGDYALTLMTCTDRGNRRLLVKCVLVDGDNPV